MITVSYAGRDRLQVEVRGHSFVTDQPIEDGGEDAAPTPTEMFVASLAACVAFYAERFLRRNGLSTDGLKVSCDYQWVENPHRVGSIDLEVAAPGLTPARRDAFSRVIRHCAVHNSLERPPSVQLNIVGEQMVAA